MATKSSVMQPPPPPPPGVGSQGPPPPMPPQLQAMMRQMQQRQPKFQQQTQPPAPYQQHQVGGRRGGRGRGRGSFQQQNYKQNCGYNNHQSHIKRKRGPSDDVRDASRFFLPSFLKDPWKELEAANGPNAANEMQYVDRQREEMRPRQVQYATNDGPGRVFFQPSFLEDPWAQFVR